MKRNNWGVTACALAVALSLAACGKKEPAAQVKPNGLPKAGANSDKGEVAFVDIDTLAAQYEYCKDGQAALQAKQKSYSSQLNAKGQALQNALAAYQKKLQSGAITSEDQARTAQTQLQRQQAQLQQYQERVEEEMAKATANYQQTLRDSLNNFLKDYNKDGRYKMILSRSGDNILYADKALDITNDVIAGLNKRYKK